jgi:hypothetical protein
MRCRGPQTLHVLARAASLAYARTLRAGTEQCGNCLNSVYGQRSSPLRTGKQVSRRSFGFSTMLATQTARITSTIINRTVMNREFIRPSDRYRRTPLWFENEPNIFFSSGFQSLREFVVVGRVVGQGFQGLNHLRIRCQPMKRCSLHSRRPRGPLLSRRGV